MTTYNIEGRTIFEAVYTILNFLSLFHTLGVMKYTRHLSKNYTIYTEDCGFLILRTTESNVINWCCSNRWENL